jgi:uncharacterized protein YjbJ (UPF0337 family)
MVAAARAMAYQGMRAEGGRYMVANALPGGDSVKSTNVAGPTHQCPVDGCSLRVGDKFLMCGKHWRMVPRALQGEVWARWNGGKVREGHAEACQRATDAVNEKLKRAKEQSNHKEKSTMNWDRIEGNWKQLKGKAKQQWGKLTDDQLDVIAGQRDQLAGKIQEEYGISKDEAEKQLADFETRYRDWNPRS